jgi:hypothetical protein
MAVKRRLPGVEEPRTELVTRPVSTYARPEPAELPPDAPARTDLLRLAQSLSGSSEALADYARAYTRANAEGGQSAAMGLRLRETTPQISERLRQPGGVPPDVNRSALEMGQGEDLAKEFFQDARQRYLGQNTAPTGTPSNAFDRNSGDIDAWFKQLMQEREGALPPGDGVRFGWNRTMLHYQHQLYAEHDNYLQQRTLQANLDAAHRAFYGIATEAIAGGERDPRTIHQRMLEALPRTQQMHLLTPQQANAALFSAARSIAEQGIPGNPQLAVSLAREMLLGERTGANGQTLPALGNSNEYAHLTNQVIEAAQRRAGELQRNLETETIVRLRDDAQNGRLNEEAAKKFFADNPHVLGPGTQAHLEQLLLQNRTAVDRAREAQQGIAENLINRARSDASQDELNRFLMRRGDEGTLQGIPERMTVLKRNGETEELQRPALLDRARDNELARIQEWGRQTAEFERDLGMGGVVQPGTPSIEERVFQRTFDFLNRNGLEHPQWRDILAGGYAAATPQAVAGQPPPILSQAVNLYEQLEAKSPGMLERHLQSQSARDFYRTYRIGRTSLRMDERQAMVFAAASTHDIGADDARAPAFQKIEKELETTFGDHGGLWGLVTAPFRGVWNVSGGLLLGQWGGPPPYNLAEVRDDVRRLSRALVRAGMTPDAAVQTAAKDAMSQYTNVNGFMVRTGDRTIESYGALLRGAGLQPRSFEDSVRRYLEAYAEDNPHAFAEIPDPAGGMPASHEPEIASAGDDAGRSFWRRGGGLSLSIRPVTNATGAWMIVDPMTGLPVPSGPNGMRQTIGLRDLVEFEQRTQRAEQDHEAARLSSEAKRLQEAARAAGAPGTVPRRTPRLLQRGWPEE